MPGTLTHSEKLERMRRLYLASLLLTVTGIFSGGLSPLAVLISSALGTVMAALLVVVALDWA